MATFIPLYSGSLQRVQARGDQWSAGRAGVGPFPFALPSKRGDFAAYTRCDLNCVAKFPLLSGEVALIGHPEARVSRVTGKFDTTASQPKWQVGFCHLRGRNQQTEVLSVENSPKMPKRHSPVGWRLGTCTRSLASRSSEVDRVHLLHSPGRFPLSGFGSCRVLRSVGRHF